MRVNLFGKDIFLKDYYCELNDEGYYNIEVPYINLYIQMKGCNASCRFCEYKDSGNNLNSDKLRFILDYLIKNINVGKISITGGEPTLDIIRLYRVMDIIDSFKSKCPNIFLVMNTNGFNLERLDKDNKISFFNSVALSRHHYDDIKNNDIFCTKTISSDILKEVISKNKDIFHFSCNLIQGYISDAAEIYNYLNYCNNIGVYDIGFVGLMKINEYCKSKFVDFNLANIFKEDIFNGKIFLTQKRKNMNECQCFNYLYLPSDGFIRPIQIYSRCVLCKNSSNSNTLVFDGEYLRLGFGGEILI